MLNRRLHCCTKYVPIQDENVHNLAHRVLQVVVHRAALDSLDLIPTPCRKTSWKMAWRGGGSTVLYGIGQNCPFDMRCILNKQQKQQQLAHSIKYQYSPQHIRMLNTPAQVTAQYSLRHARTWHLPPSRTDRCKDSPLYKSLEHYNALPASIHDVSSQPAFKQEICSLLINSICSCSAHPLPYL